MNKLPQSLSVVADANIPGLSHYFSQGVLSWAKGHGVQTVTIKPFSAQELTAQDLTDADVLLVRSVNQVNAQFLAHANKLKFVGSCTSGIDHLDTDFLTAEGISWAHALGCNANAVAEYVLLQVLRYCVATDRALEGLTVCVFGFGQTGSRVVQKLSLFGCQIIVVDPFKLPSADSDLLQAAPHLVDTARLDRVRIVGAESISQADIVTLHVPLSMDGPHPTHHMIGLDQVESMPEDSLLINACRGAVVNLSAILAWRSRQKASVAHRKKWVFDVFENEPEVSPDLLAQLFGATPHIAGHSQLGKELGTRMIWQQFMAWAGIEIEEQSQSYSSPLTRVDYVMSQERLNTSHWLAFLEHALRLVHAETLLRSWAPPHHKQGDHSHAVGMNPAFQKAFTQSAFLSVRSDYLPRAELSQVHLNASSLDSEDCSRLKSLGVRFHLNDH